MTINATDLDLGSAYNLFIGSIIPKEHGDATDASNHRKRS
jgi:hypothetical protein